ncbi:LANO_0G07954g1_1 [Lachancea nothofagi CBS 11611]|uniref:LANO_0G07954g1_1 n=1 Tax=Lachancea nothofagi CBS 11611 TaxID=1266666 RepID=A0A1G4KHL8_9SACH|nr:LANO_0G07954g1_1 [Lachancea nothofagi CBS 11611]
MSFGGRNKTPCKYFQQGRCKKGNSCTFAHVYTGGNNGGNNGNNGGTNSGDRYQTFVNASNLGKYAKEIEDDMSSCSELRFQPLTSSYGLGNPCAVNLIQGRDLSPEESRLLFYQSQMQNSIPAYDVQMKARALDIDQCRRYVAADTRKAARYLQLATQKTNETGALPARGFIEHPLDLTGESYSKVSSAGSTNLFGSAPAPQTSHTFGQPISGTPSATTGAFGSSSAFGAPSFGSSSMSGAFGQPKFGSAPAPNAFGSNATTAFGAAPGFGTNNSPFGNQTANAPGSASAFGPPAFGSNLNNTSAFGKPSFGSTSSSQPSAFGQNNPTPGITGSQTSSSSPIGSAFGKPAFGQIAGSSPFAAVQNAQTLPSPFGSAATTSNAGNPSGASSAFGSSAFQNPAKPADSNKPFGSASAIQSGAFGSSAGFPSNSQTTPSPFSSTQPNAFTAQGPTQQQQSQAQHNPGPMNPHAKTFVQGLPMEQEISESDLPKEVIEYFRSERFALGKVPDIPPPAMLIN